MQRKHHSDPFALESRGVVARCTMVLGLVCDVHCWINGKSAPFPPLRTLGHRTWQPAAHRFEVSPLFKVKWSLQGQKTHLKSLK